MYGFIRWAYVVAVPTIWTGKVGSTEPEACRLAVPSAVDIVSRADAVCVFLRPGPAGSYLVGSPTSGLRPVPGGVRDRRVRSSPAPS